MLDDTHTTPITQESILQVLDLDRADIKEFIVETRNDELNIKILLNVKVHNCPICGASTTNIKGYQKKNIIHTILTTKKCNIEYNARRYVCPICGKTFYENNPFAYVGSKLSLVTVYNVLSDLKRPEATFTYVAKKNYISPSTVSNIFDKHINISRKPLPQYLSLDEVHAFSGIQGDYVCVLTEWPTGKIIDVLPSRRKEHLIDYFTHIPLEERKNVKYVCSDMWRTYRNVSKLFFPNSSHIADHFHITMNMGKIVDKVRVKVMKRYTLQYEKLRDKRNLLKQNNERLKPIEMTQLSEADINKYLLTKFHWVLTSSNDSILDPNNKKKLNRKLNRYLNYYDIYETIIDIDQELKETVEIYNDLSLFYSNCTIKDAPQELKKIIDRCRNSNITLLNTYGNTLNEWKGSIINSFNYISLSVPDKKTKEIVTINKRMSNGLAENRNRPIQLIKSSSNGYTSWKRFRARVLYCLNDEEKPRL